MAKKKNKEQKMVTQTGPLADDVVYELTPKGEELAKKIEEKNSDIYVEQKEIKDEVKNLKKSINDKLRTSDELIDDSEMLDEMMDGEHEYVKAKRIRKQKWTDLLADKLVAGGGIGESLKSTISEKTKAKITGIKEKFDPLNIAKFMTGGSRLGPALLGKILGRKQEDIEHFSGKAKPVGETATKISSLESSNGMLTVLMDIYELLRKNHEDDVLRREEENAYKKENSLESNKRQEKLLEAIKSLKNKKQNDKNDTAEKIDESSFLDFFGLAEMGKAALQIIKSLGAFIVGPVGGALLGGALTIGALYWLINYAADNMPNYAAITPEQAAEMLERNDPNEMAKYGGREGLIKHINETPERAQYLIDRLKDPELGEMEKDAIEKEILSLGGMEQVEKIAERGTVQVPEKVAEPSTQYKEKIHAMPTAETFPKDSPQRLKLRQDTWRKKFGLVYNEDGTLKTQAERDHGSTTKENNTESPEPTNKVPEPATKEEVAVPVPAVNAGTKLNQVVAENNQAKINDLVKPSTPTINNTIATTSGKKELNLLPQVSIPAVRNLEETFQRMIIYSTRVV